MINNMSHCMQLKITNCKNNKNNNSMNNKDMRVNLKVLTKSRKARPFRTNKVVIQSNWKYKIMKKGML